MPRFGGLSGRNNTTYMNARVEQFIDRMKEEQKVKELKQKEAHLISIGLIDESKSHTERVYCDGTGFDSDVKLDTEKQMYYKEVKKVFPIEVTDEEYQEILKYAPVSESTAEQVNGNTSKRTWSNIIKTIARIYLIGGILINLFTLLMLDRDYMSDNVFYQFLGESLITIFFISVSFPFVMGLSTIVAAAEKYLRK